MLLKEKIEVLSNQIEVLSENFDKDKDLKRVKWLLKKLDDAGRQQFYRDNRNKRSLVSKTEDNKTNEKN